MTDFKRENGNLGLFSSLVYSGVAIVLWAPCSHPH